MPLEVQSSARASGSGRSEKGCASEDLSDEMKRNGAKEPRRSDGKGVVRREVRTQHAPWELRWTGRSGYSHHEHDAALSGTSGKKSPQKGWASLAKQQIHHLNSEWYERTRGRAVDVDTAREMKGKEGQVAVVPLVQMAPLGVYDEVRFVNLLPSWISESQPPTQTRSTMRVADDVTASPSTISAGSTSRSFSSTISTSPTLTLTTGYFCLSPSWTRTILMLARRLQIDILAASPQSNGFFGSKGISRHLPPAYTFLEHVFWSRAKRLGVLAQQGKREGVSLREWTRSGWTYHAKGQWGL